LRSSVRARRTESARTEISTGEAGGLATVSITAATSRKSLWNTTGPAPEGRSVIESTRPFRSSNSFPMSSTSRSVT